MNRRRVARQSRRQSPNQADPPLTTTPRRRASVAEPEEAAKLAIARRARPGAPPGHVRLVLTLELRRALARPGHPVGQEPGSYRDRHAGGRGQAMTEPTDRAVFLLQRISELLLA